MSSVAPADKTYKLTEKEYDEMRKKEYEDLKSGDKHVADVFNYLMQGYESPHELRDMKSSLTRMQLLGMYKRKEYDAIFEILMEYGDARGYGDARIGDKE